jgi:hypothetical protein
MSRVPRRLTVASLAALVACLACMAPADRATKGTSAPIASPIHVERLVALGPDSVPLRFTLDAPRLGVDDPDVTLVVRAGDRVVWRRAWNSSAYLQCDECDDGPGSKPRSDPVTKVRTLLDSSLVAGGQGEPYWEEEDHASTLLASIGPQLLPTGSSPADSQAVRDAAGDGERSPLLARAQRVRAEQMGQAWFDLDFGNDAYCLLGWSPSEHRLLELLCEP